MFLDFLFTGNDSNATKVYTSALKSAHHYFPERFAAPSTTVQERIQKFEAIVIFMALNLWHLKKAESLSAQRCMRRATNIMFDQFEIALREQGVSDIRIKPEIKKLAYAFNGRLKAYEQGFEAKDASLIAHALQRNHVCDKDMALKLGIHLAAQARDVERMCNDTWLELLDHPKMFDTHHKLNNAV